MTLTSAGARTAIINYFGTNPLPSLATALDQPHWLASTVASLEALYSERANLDTAGVQLLADLSAFISAHNFHGKAERAALMAGVAARIIEGGAAVAEGDPANISSRANHGN